MLATTRGSGDGAFRTPLRVCQGLRGGCGHPRGDVQGAVGSTRGEAVGLGETSLGARSEGTSA